MAVDVIDMLRNLIQGILTDRATAAQYAEDPDGTLVAQGITEGDLGGVDMRQLVGDVCGSADVPADTRSALQGYTSGGGSHGAVHPPATSSSHSVDQVMQHLNYVTYATYQDDHSITQHIVDSSTTIDSSTDLDVDGDVHGDIAVDADSAIATGAGAVAGAGAGDIAAATGDGAQVIDDSLVGQANTGDGAAQVGGDNAGVLNTGVNTGVQAGDDVTNAVVGDRNQTAQVDGHADGPVFDFGGGDVSNISHSNVQDSAVSAGGDATSVSDNVVDGGSAVSTGDASGHDEDNDQVSTETTVNTVEAHDSVVGTEQGAGDNEVREHTEVDAF